MSNTAATTGRSARQPEHEAGSGAGQDGLSATELQRIKHRAHALWREEGSPQGRDREFWERAELQVLKGRGAA